MTEDEKERLFSSAIEFKNNSSDFGKKIKKTPKELIYVCAYLHLSGGTWKDIKKYLQDEFGRGKQVEAIRKHVSALKKKGLVLEDVVKFFKPEDKDSFPTEKDADEMQKKHIKNSRPEVTDESSRGARELNPLSDRNEAEIKIINRKASKLKQPVYFSGDPKIESKIDELEQEINAGDFDAPKKADYRLWIDYFCRYEADDNFRKCLKESRPMVDVENKDRRVEYYRVTQDKEKRKPVHFEEDPAV